MIGRAGYLGLLTGAMLVAGCTPYGSPDGYQSTLAAPFGDRQRRLTAALPPPPIAARVCRPVQSYWTIRHRRPGVITVNACNTATG